MLPSQTYTHTQARTHTDIGGFMSGKQWTFFQTGSSWGRESGEVGPSLLID